MIKKILKFFLKSVGLQKIPTSSSLNDLSLESALARINVKDIKIKTVIDVGASNGGWSAIVKRFFPDSFYYLIEANPIHTDSLQKLKQKWSNYDYILAAAGDTIGEIYFDGRDPFGGLASHKPSQESNLRVPVITVDHIVETQQLQPPYLLKLDTHGFEIPIFEGANKTLKKTNLIIVETYNFDIAPQSLRFYQICEYLEKKGFRCVDLCDPLFRPKDQSFWQFDLFFVPSSDPIFENNEYL